ncbi:hypothetical protein PBRA_001276 [Plasmodiophora brassicae]|uniref:Uncharacterized protein n=1 Tax=Plasmodiophora brassicae TaxID=37360 RepID=A0A0G4IVN8_PLABS|nr:hypothetical protein PBRA_001276 [Plasmodiophora brassicae]
MYTGDPGVNARRPAGANGLLNVTLVAPFCWEPLTSVSTDPLGNGPGCVCDDENPLNTVRLPDASSIHAVADSVFRWPSGALDHPSEIHPGVLPDSLNVTTFAIVSVVQDTCMTPSAVTKAPLPAEGVLDGKMEMGATPRLSCSGYDVGDCPSWLE